jgi:hypothetical protein
MLGKRYEEAAAKGKGHEECQRAVGDEIVAGILVALEDDPVTGGGIRIRGGGYEAPFLRAWRCGL